MNDIKNSTGLKRRIIFILLLSICAGFALLPAAVILAIQDAPLVEPQSPLTFDDAARVKTLLRENNPRRMRPGEVKSAALTERECNLILNYGLSRSPGRKRLSASLHFAPEEARLKTSLRLPGNPIGKYANVDLGITPSEKVIDVTHLRIGALPVPAIWVNTIRNIAWWYVEADNNLGFVLEAAKSLQSLSFEHQTARLTYEWRPNIMRHIKQQGQNLFFSKTDRDAMLRYHALIERIAADVEEKRPSLSRFLPPLFRFAKMRTEAGADPVNENRYLILTLGTYCLGKRIHRLIGLPPQQSKFKRKGILLAKRRDLAKHFMVSAALAASAGSGLANFAGVFKEVSDSQGGSGFSFADLLADRAGVKLGALAVGSSSEAKHLQERMATVTEESDFMPAIEDMQEGLQEEAFKRRYKDLDSKSYKAVEDEIDKRIADCSVYQQ